MQLQHGLPLLVGEFGGRRVDTVSAEGRWQRQFLDYIGRAGLSWTYWALNPDSGDTGGILRDDWVTVDGPKMRLLTQLLRRRRIEGGGRAFGSPPPAARPVPQRPGPRPQRKPRPRAPVPQALTVRVEEQARWDGGSCARLVISGPAAALAGFSVTLDVPRGSAIAQSWNAETSGTTGRVRITLPSWARLEAGEPYTATGFCVAGVGRVAVVR